MLVVLLSLLFKDFFCNLERKLQIKDLAWAKAN